MDFQEAMEIIKAVRANRRIDKLIPKKVAASKKAKAQRAAPKPKLTLQEALAQLPEEVRLKMIKDLEEQTK